MSAPPRSAPAARWLGPAVVAALFVLLAAWSWGKWTDPQVDFGVELYVPWQLTEGKVLYRDIATRNGPLSHYVNALWFELFGVSLRTLVWCNLAILAAVCAMTWRIFERACGRFPAAVCCSVLLCLFGFSQYTLIANYNWVTPYQHAQTHGLALSLAMILALSDAVATGRRRSFALAGGCLGLVFLTKAELFVPAGATALTALLLCSVTTSGRASMPGSLAALAAGAAIPIAGFTGLLASRMPAAEAWNGVLGNWRHLGGGLFGDPFYRRTMGVDDPAANLASAAFAFACVAAFTAATVWADRVVPARFRQRPTLRIGAAATLAVLLFAAGLPWVSLARALPATTAVLGVWILSRCVRDLRMGAASGPAWVPLALWSVLALTLLGKVILHTRFGQYGFVLAMPSTLLLALALVGLVPQRLREADARPGAGLLARALGGAAVVACVAFFLGVSQRHYETKTLAIGSGADRMLARPPPRNPRAKVIALSLERLDELLPEDATLLVWPEGVGINYWLRRVDPSRYNLFLPTEVAAFGERNVLEDVARHPPDWIALLHRDHVDFGAGRFGQDPRNGQAFLRWVEEHYERVLRIGAEPFQSRAPGMVILRRRGTGE